MKLIKNDRGFTLMEMMVYVVLAGMLLATAVTAFLAQNKSYNRQDVITEIQQNIRGAFEPMVADVRFAGMGLLEDSSKDAFQFAQENTFTVNYKVDGTKVEIKYELSGDVLERTVDGTPGVLAENIERLRFEYFFDSDPTSGKKWEWANDADEITSVLFPSETTNKKALEQIRAVKIVMLGSARPAAFNPSDPGTYNPPLESAVVNWPVTPNSGYKRMMSVIAQCRNNHE